MIKGIGIDLVDLKRLEIKADDRLIERILNSQEKALFDNITDKTAKLAFLGGRFAAKEAIFKAIGSGKGDTYYRDFAILKNDNGSPYVESERISADEVFHISITHTDDHAIAYVIIEVP